MDLFFVQKKCVKGLTKFMRMIIINLQLVETYYQLKQLMEAMNLNLDRMLAYHCAPTLFGLKPANLIAHDAIHKHYSDEAFDMAKAALKIRDVHMARLCSCDQKELTLVYNKTVLEKHLQSPEIWGYLLVHGYPMYGTFDEVITHLKKRIIESGGFPHEVGVFLGYPLEDVMGFIKNKGQNCKFCGYWKVYGDEAQARKLFDAYSSARDEMVMRVTAGHSLTEILKAA